MLRGAALQAGLPIPACSFQKVLAVGLWVHKGRAEHPRCREKPGSTCRAGAAGTAAAKHQGWPNGPRSGRQGAYERRPGPAQPSPAAAPSRLPVQSRPRIPGLRRSSQSGKGWEALPGLKILPGTSRERRGFSSSTLRDSSPGEEMASVRQSMESAVGWRSHKILSELEDSPLPDRFKKKSSCNLSSLRMSLRKWMPLKEVEINFNENPTWESLEAKEKSQSLRALTRMATNVLGTVSQKIQKSCQAPTHSLVTSFASMGNPGCSIQPKGSPPRTPQRKSKRVAAALTPTSATKILSPSDPRSSVQPGSHWLKREALRLRRSRRAAALRSPYGSSPSAGHQRQLDCDLELVSRGIRQLKRLSRVFDDIIVQEERDQAITNYYQVMTRNIQSARLRSRNRSLLKRRVAQLQRTLGGWADHHFKQY